MSDIVTTIVAPEVPVRVRHATIVDSFDALQSGTAMLLVNDHDPKPLYYLFQAERTGLFEWEYMEQGPEQYVVKIKRI